MRPRATLLEVGLSFHFIWLMSYDAAMVVVHYMKSFCLN